MPGMTEKKEESDDQETLERYDVEIPQVRHMKNTLS